MEVTFKLCPSIAVTEVSEWVQVGMDVHIPHCKYEVKPCSSLCLTAACTAAIDDGNNFFHLFQKVKLRQASNHCKRVLEAAQTYLC